MGGGREQEGISRCAMIIRGGAMGFRGGVAGWDGRGVFLLGGRKTRIFLPRIPALIPPKTSIRGALRIGDPGSRLRSLIMMIIARGRLISLSPGVSIHSMGRLRSRVPWIMVQRRERRVMMTRCGRRREDRGSERMRVRVNVGRRARGRTPCLLSLCLLRVPALVPLFGRHGIPG